jgi:poly(3-hydroxybutyrate) depolymerase
MIARFARLAGLAYPLAILFQLNLVHADDGMGLRRGANPGEVSISGVSAGAAMAVQYAVAHSATIMGVGAIAGPPWHCADGHLAQSVNRCMCGREAIPPKADEARALAGRGEIDPLVSGRPTALKQSYVFQSAGDGTVKKPSGEASIAFLADFIGKAPVADFGNATDQSNAARHGIISPEGTDQCDIENDNDTYIRKCRAEDNAGKLLLALLAPGQHYDTQFRQADIPASDIWAFSQQPMIEAVKSSAGFITIDTMLGFRSARRLDLDMADKGYIYVPPACRQAGSRCGIHVALHGCRQDARQFAIRAGYNNWAQHYRIMILYPAIKPDSFPVAGNVCTKGVFSDAFDRATFEPNYNGCWDWWGYLDSPSDERRYVGKGAPQMQVIKRILDEVTAPRSAASGPVDGQP